MKIDNETSLSQKFLENMHDAVFILDENYHILDCNFMAESWYGYSKQEFSQLTLGDVRAESEREKVKTQMRDVSNNEGSTWETVHLRKNGTTFPVEVSSTPIMLGKERRFYHVVRDISDRKKAEEILRSSEERYRQIVELSPDTIYIHADGKVLFMNKAGLKLFGAISPEQIIGKSVWNLYPPDRHGIVRARNQKMLETKQEVPLIEHTMQRLDGTLIEVEAIARYISYEDRDAFYVIIRDITERKKTNLLLKMQYGASKELIESTNLVDAVTNILREICNNLKFKEGRLWSLDKKDGLLRCIAAWSEENIADKISEKVSRQVTIKAGEGMAGEVLLDQLPKCNDEGCVATPILNKKEMIGVMEFSKKNNHTRDDSILDALSGIANQLGSFMKRKSFEKELIYISKHDVITNLPNRFLFEETLALDLNIAKNNDQKLALLFLDVNDFGSINEGMGHAIGDKLLKSIADRLLESGCTIATLARFSADQFTIILNNIAGVEDVSDFVEKINKAISKPFMISGHNIVNVTTNIGVGIYPEDGEDVQTLLRNSNIALNNAKQYGRSVLQFCSVDMTAKAKKRLSIAQALRSAVIANEFELNYQPIVESKSNSINGYEALIRWHHQDRYIPPGEFIPIAEQTQLIVPIGEWSLRTACQQTKLWNDQFNHTISVSVNISPVQFKHVKILDLLTEVLKNTGLKPQLLKIEVTESGIIDDIKTSIDTLNKIKNMGIKICIDDFGTGYSSLSYLKKLPIDYLKVDQSFVREVTNNPNDASIVRTIIDLARNLGYKVIAEGVETEAQLRFLKEIGCHEIQGYYFSRPMAVEEATQFLQQDKLL